MDNTSQIDITVDNKKLLKVIQKVSRDLFNVLDFKYWDNIVICGGYALDLLYGTELSSDIDIYIYNLPEGHALLEEISNEILRLTNGRIVYETGSVITFVTKGKRVQLINASSRQTAKDIVDKFDIGVSKVYFDGYLIYSQNSVEELTSHTISLEKLSPKQQTYDRLAKYIQIKKFGLSDMQEACETIDPLYFFKECHQVDKTFQTLLLANDKSMLEKYNLIFLRKNPFQEKLKNIAQYGRNDIKIDVNDKTSSKGKKKCVHENRGMSSELEDFDPIDLNSFNKFGLCNILYKIKTGNYTFEELYESQDTDISGFNVSCYMVMYEQDEKKVIEYFSNSDKFSSKNFNVYDFSYLEIASLLNRQQLVKFFITKHNYKTVMRIAVYEDNLDLYLMAYKLFNSDDRYLYSKEKLLKKKAYKICTELYGEKSIGSSLSKKKVNDKKNKLEEDILKCNTIEEFLNFYCSNKYGPREIINYLESKCYKNIVCDDSYKDGFRPQIESMFCQYKSKQINSNSNQLFNKFLAYVVDKKTFQKMTEYHFTSPLYDPYTLDVAIKMAEGKLSETYTFDNEVLNELIVMLDNPSLVSENSNKDSLLEKVLDKFELGQNLTEYTKENFKKDPIAYYSKILCFDQQHISAYMNELEESYVRKENAIGYTPDDIIMFKTFNDYKNSVVNPSRSNSVKLIDRTKQIVPFDGVITREFVAECLKDTFDFDNIVCQAIKSTADCSKTFRKTGYNHVELDSDEEVEEVEEKVSKKASYKASKKCDPCDDDSVEE